jgi:hypothetical protein
MQTRLMVSDFWPVCAVIARNLTPGLAASVMNPLATGQDSVMGSQ